MFDVSTRSLLDVRPLELSKARNQLITDQTYQKLPGHRQRKPSRPNRSMSNQPTADGGDAKQRMI